MFDGSRHPTHRGEAANWTTWGRVGFTGTKKIVSGSTVGY